MDNKDMPMYISTFCYKYRDNGRLKYIKDCHKEVRRHIKRIYKAWGIDLEKDIRSKYGQTGYYEIPKDKEQFLCDSLNDCNTIADIKREIEKSKKYKVESFEFVEEYCKANFYEEEYDDNGNCTGNLYRDVLENKMKKIQKEHIEYEKECIEHEKEDRAYRECMGRLNETAKTYDRHSMMIFNAIDAKLLLIEEMLEIKNIYGREEKINKYYKMACLFNEIDEALRDLKKVKDAMKVALKYPID